jgi:hypothetical protein
MEQPYRSTARRSAEIVDLASELLASIHASW